MHSESPLSIQVGDAVSTNLETDAQQMILREQGIVSQNHHEVCLYRFPQRSLTDSYMFGAENRTTVPMEVTFNMGKSINFACNGASHIAKKVIEPNRTEFLMYVKREVTADDMLIDYDFKFREQ
mmetsp:Transcript_31110/g.30565  ORF Transcript_31110/g.30565 Transcript_31110/m.30565 type:complete len:124 (+) Transcript_31110:530-901(+)